MGYLDVTQLTEAEGGLPEDDVDLPGKGTVRVRGMTRGEVMRVRSQVKSIADAIKRSAELECKMLAVAMVQPPMTVAEARLWQESSAAGEIDLVVNKVQELSGLNEGEAKAAYKEMAADPDAEFRLPAG